LNQSQGPPPREPPSTQRQQRNPNETAPPSAQQRRDPYETSPPSTQQQRSHYETISPPTQQQDWYKPPKDNYTPPPPGGYYAPRPAQVDEAPLPSNHRSQRHGPLSSGVPDPPAYIHNTALRQGLDPRMSPPAQTQDIAPARPSATFPQTSPQPSSSSVPRSSTVHSTSREPFSQRQRHESKSSGSTWTRFSQHGGSTSRQDQSRPTSNTTQKSSYQEPTSYPSLARTSKSYHVPSRSDSPPPPPPPPKDDWNRPRLQESTPSNVPSRSSQPTYSPSQTSPRPPSTQYRQSLPPLQTNVASKPRSAVTSGKTRTPEEKRRSRQQEIENATMKPQTPPNDGVRTGSRRVGDTEDEPVVMSATSFPGQEWQPDYLHWDGD